MGIKGDIQILTAVDGAVLLSVDATDGHMLIIDSSAATGMKWAVGNGGSDALFQLALIR